MEGASCGYAVSAEIQAVSKAGFLAKVEIRNVSGPTGRSFSLFVDAGAALIEDVAHGTAEVTEGGYILRPVGSLEASQLDPGSRTSFSSSSKAGVQRTPRVRTRRERGQLRSRSTHGRALDQRGLLHVGRYAPPRS